MVVVNTNTRQHRTISSRWNDLFVIFLPQQGATRKPLRSACLVTAALHLNSRRWQCWPLVNICYNRPPLKTPKTAHCVKAQNLTWPSNRRLLVRQAPQQLFAHSYFNPPYRIRRTVGQQPTSNPCDHQTSHSPPEHRNGRADTEQCLL